MTCKVRMVRDLFAKVPPVSGSAVGVAGVKCDATPWSLSRSDADRAVKLSSLSID